MPVCKAERDDYLALRSRNYTNFLGAGTHLILVVKNNRGAISATLHQFCFLALPTKIDGNTTRHHKFLPPNKERELGQVKNIRET